MLRKFGLTILYVTLPVIVSLMVFGALSTFFMAAQDPQDQTERLFDVPLNTSLRAIAKRLQDQGLIRSKWSVIILAKLKGVGSSIRAGEYQLTHAMKPQQILQQLTSGKVFLRKVTVKEGQTMMAIGQLLERSWIIPREDFFKILADKVLLQKLGIDSFNFEGYLFPETYQFPRGTSAEKIVTTMYEELQNRWKPEWDVRLTELGMTRHQILTLASIIEKESGQVSEQPLISSVFHNRLKRQMPLQSDPTVIYLLWAFDGNLRKQDLQTQHPYNTYVIRGLPPGPIANTGLSAIEAALFPARSNFLFFVGNGEGSHVFSETLDQHNNAVNKYQRKIAN